MFVPQMPHLFLYPPNNETQTTIKHSTRRPFTVSEDVRLLDIISKSSEFNWTKISRQLGYRTARQCRDRWLNYLNPNIRDDPWTDEEDKILLEKVNELGYSWSIIRKFFQGRSENDVKNRWYSHLKYRITQKEGKYQFITNPLENKYPHRKKRQRVKTSPHLYARAILEQNKQLSLEQQDEPENEQNCIEPINQKKEDIQKMLSIDFLLN